MEIELSRTLERLDACACGNKVHMQGNGGQLGIVMTPAEARKLARDLDESADEAEKKNATAATVAI